MVDNPETLENLIQGFGDDRKVFEVQVATPPWINQFGRWLVEPVECLMIGEHALGHDVHIYRLPCGRTYYWGLAGEDEADRIGTRRLVFLSPGISASEAH
ncbi:hypothetical protein [Pseudomonas aeruginosa]|uniref:hypothetical protein n=1 Tax=Pseudomonas aeruginosa TaxID=287 RepID=UPI0012DC7935|nr:hypothetical protein [Pseudomonas aeruginosa]